MKKQRDAYLRYALHLRELAQQNPKTLPPKNRRRETDIGFQPQFGAFFSLPKNRHNPSDRKSDARVKAALAGQNGVHASPFFQGFAWVITFSNHSHGNLAIAIIDAKTAKVLDVFSPVK